MSNDWRNILQETALLLADVSLTYIFYRLYRNRCSSANKIDALEPIDISEAQRRLSEFPHSSIEYAAVEGKVQSINDPLKSSFSEAEGPLRHFKRVLMKSERHKTYWVDSTTTISENLDRVPFMLFSHNSSDSILVNDSACADFLTDAMHTTHDQFEPNNRTLMETAFDRLIGEISKGVQSTETLLKNGTALLGIGKIVSNKGTLELRKPTESDAPYILTSMTKEELVQRMKSKARVFKIIAGIFGVAGAVILLVTYGARFKRYLEYRRSRQAMNEIRQQLTAMRENQNAENGDNNSPVVQEANPCVVCLTQAREIALRPCGHVCTCLSCYEAMPDRKLCPVCRGVVTDIVPVFIP